MIGIVLLSLFLFETDAWEICTLSGTCEQTDPVAGRFTKHDVEQLAKARFKAPDTIPGIRIKVNLY